MAVKELGHVVLFVEDLARSRAFYRDLLGFNEVLHTPDRAAAYSSGRTHHELLLIAVGPAQPVPQGHRLGMYHFGLKVGDTDQDLRNVLARLHSSKTRIVGASDHGVTHSLYVLDPDGNEVELYIDVAGADWKLLATDPKPLRL